MAGQTLTPKQQAFVAEYLIDLNGKQAAIRAGYSPATASVIASENLQKPYLGEIIAEAIEKRAEQCGIDAAWVLREAKRTYDACHAADKLSEAVSALKLVGTHVDVQAFKERIASETTITFSPEAGSWLGR